METVNRKVQLERVLKKQTNHLDILRIYLFKLSINSQKIEKKTKVMETKQNITNNQNSVIKNSKKQVQLTLHLKKLSNSKFKILLLSNRLGEVNKVSLTNQILSNYMEYLMIFKMFIFYLSFVITEIFTSTC